MSEAKNNTVTYVKAIGIVLMVLGHTLFGGNIINDVIYTFHMPLFFLMSGYCFKLKYLDDAKQFVIRKIKGIYVPFVAFSLVFLALHNVFCSLYFYEPDMLYKWQDFAWNTGRIVTRMSHNEGLLGTFWFLKELFWGNLIFYGVMKVMKGRVLPTVIGLFAIAEFLCIFNLRIPYFNVTCDTFYAAYFISFGYLWRVKSDRMNELSIWGKWCIWVIVVGILIAEVCVSDDLGMLRNTPISMIYYAIPAIGTSIMVFEGCRRLEAILNEKVSRLVIFIGNHSLSIMALHFTAFKLVSLVLIKAHHVPIERLVEFPVVRECANGGGAILLYTFVGVCFPLVCAWLWQRGVERMKELEN